MENAENAAIMRAGFVSDYDPKRHMARVKFPDKSDLISDWLQVVVPNTAKNKDEFHLDIDEHVVCLMMGNGRERGYVLGSLWDDKNKPPTGDVDVRCTEYKDGTRVSYDRKNHKLEIECEGDIEILAKGDITVKANGKVHTFGAIIDHN